MAMPMEYAATQAAQGRNKGVLDFLGGNLVGAAQQGIGTGLSGYLQNRQVQAQNLAQPQPQPQASIPGQINKGQAGAMPQMNNTQQLADILQQATARKVGMMSQGMQQQAPTNPQMWQQRASQAVDQTNQGGQPPSWGGNKASAPQGFDFNQYLGGMGASLNPLSSLGGDQSGSESAAGDVEKPWYKKAASGAGNLLMSAALPVASSGLVTGGIGAAIGGGLGALGYLANKYGEY